MPTSVFDTFRIQVNLKKKYHARLYPILSYPITGMYTCIYLDINKYSGVWVYLEIIR